MTDPDFLEVDVAALCDDLAGEINKTYQNLPWALKHEAVSRLKRQVHGLSQAVAGARKSTSKARTEKLLGEALTLAHECVPLMVLALKKNLLSAELQERWAKRLTVIDRHLEQWQRASSR
jgi:hypothetical protein